MLQDLDKISQKITELVSQIRDLKASYQNAQDSLNATAHERDQLKQKLTEQQSHYEDMEQQIAHHDSVLTQQKQAHEQELIRQRQSLESEIEKAKTDAEQKSVALLAEVSQLKQQLSTSQEQLTHIQKRYSDLLDGAKQARSQVEKIIAHLPSIGEA